MNEQTYDVFLCFKNLASDGTQTWDNVLAKEIFAFLSAQGLRVFLSNVSLERLGVAAYKRAIDDALDSAAVLVAVGTTVEHLESEWVRYEWDSFFNDILSGRKPQARIFSYVENIDLNSLPRTLRQNQVIVHQPHSLQLLFSFISNSLTVQSVAKVTEESKATVSRLNRLIKVMAESRLLELEITKTLFGSMFTTDQSGRMNQHIEELRRLTEHEQHGQS